MLQILCNFGLFLSKFGCRGNSLGSLVNLDSIFEFADPEKTYHTRKNCVDILCRNEVLAYLYACIGNFLDFCEKLSKLLKKLIKPQIIIIIIMWLVQSWTLPFVRACSMPVDSALGGRRLLAQC